MADAFGKKYGIKVSVYNANSEPFCSGSFKKHRE